MYYWVIQFIEKPGGRQKLFKKGPYSLSAQAQRVADKLTGPGRAEVVETTSSDWSRARGEVMTQLTDRSHSLVLSAEKVYSSVEEVKETKTPRPKVRRIGPGLLSSRRGGRRRTSDEPDDVRHYVAN